jgi:hypothetical protein
MGWPEAIAFCALVIGLIAGAGIWLDAHGRRLKHREREMEMQIKLAATGQSAETAELTKLEQRLRVLERIATDKRGKLAAEIEDLREDADAR